MRRDFIRLTTTCCFLTLGALPQAAGAATVTANVPFSKSVQNDCGAAGECELAFGTVPAKHEWLIKYVSCTGDIVNVSGKVGQWTLFAFQGNFRYGQVFLRPTLLGTFAGAFVVYNATEQSYLRVPAGGVVVVDFGRDGSTPGGTSLQCTIGGDNMTLQ